jgi:hypothetical protein
MNEEIESIAARIKFDSDNGGQSFRFVYLSMAYTIWQVLHSRKTPTLDRELDTAVPLRIRAMALNEGVNLGLLERRDWRGTPGWQAK